MLTFEKGLVRHCPQLRLASFEAEMITEPECRSGLRPEFAFWTGAGAGVNILSSSRSRSRSQY